MTMTRSSLNYIYIALVCAAFAGAGRVDLDDANRLTVAGYIATHANVKGGCR